MTEKVLPLIESPATISLDFDDFPCVTSTCWSIFQYAGFCNPTIQWPSRPILFIIKFHIYGTAFFQLYASTACRLVYSYVNSFSTIEFGSNFSKSLADESFEVAASGGIATTITSIGMISKEANYH